MKSSTSAARLKDNKKKKVINPGSFPERTYSLWKYWFSHYPAVGPYSNMLNWTTTIQTPPLKTGRGQKSYLNTYILDLRRKAKPYS